MMPARRSASVRWSSPTSMADPAVDRLGQYNLLAEAFGGRPLPVVAGGPGTATYTDGRLVAVDPAWPPEILRAQVALHAALVGAGSIEPGICRRLIARPAAASRY